MLPPTSRPYGILIDRCSNSGVPKKTVDATYNPQNSREAALVGKINGVESVDLGEFVNSSDFKDWLSTQTAK
jgi:hypothetical protein